MISAMRVPQRGLGGSGLRAPGGLAWLGHSAGARRHEWTRWRDDVSGPKPGPTPISLIFAVERGDMDVTMSVWGAAAEQELASLEDWLRNEPGLRGSSLRRESAPPEPGTMGALADTLAVALGSGGAGAVLASSLGIWLSSRVGEVKLVVTGARGTVELSATNVKDPESLLATAIGGATAAELGDGQA